MLSGAQVHLLLNHIPILGIPFILGLLLFGLWRRAADIQRVSLGALVLVALLTIPAFVSGDDAEEIVEDYPGISEVMIEGHEEFAEIAFWFLEGLAVVSLAGLVIYRGPRSMPKWFLLLVVVGLLVGAGLMARVGHLGGLINHPEIRSVQTTSIDGSHLQGLQELRQDPDETDSDE